MSDISIERAQLLLSHEIEVMEEDVTDASTTIGRDVGSLIHVLNTLENGGYRPTLTAPTRLLAGEILKAHRQNQARLAMLIDGLKRLAE